MKFAWLGCHLEGVPALTTLLEQGTLEAVITLKPEYVAKRSAVADYRALMAGRAIPFYEIAHVNNPESAQLLRNLQLDVLFVIGWSQIIAPEILAIPRIGMIGAHASLLPHNRGSAPVNWALIKGERQTGNSLIWLASDLDEGDVIDQTVIPITEYDTCATVYDCVAVSNREMILRALPKIIQGARPGQKQQHSDEPLLPRRRPNDGLVDWNRPNAEIYNFVRGLTRPYPGAFSFLDGRRWHIWNCALLTSNLNHAAAGEIVGPVISPNVQACGQLVGCGKGQILLLEIESDDGNVLAGQRLSQQAWTGKRWLRE